VLPIVVQPRSASGWVPSRACRGRATYPKKPASFFSKDIINARAASSAAAHFIRNVQDFVEAGRGSDEIKEMCAQIGAQHPLFTLQVPQTCRCAFYFDLALGLCLPEYY